MTAAPAEAAAGPVARPRPRAGGCAPATLFALMAVIAVVMLYPFYYMLNNAFRTQTQFDQQSGHSAVSWRQLFTELPVWRELLNSTIICATAIALILAVVHQPPGSRSPSSATGAAASVFLAVVAALLVPLQSIIIPEYVNLGKLGLINTYPAPSWSTSALGIRRSPRS